MVIVAFVYDNIFQLKHFPLWMIKVTEIQDDKSLCHCILS